MPLQLPTNYANSRFLFTVAGLTDEVGFSIATLSPPTMDAADIAEAMADLSEGSILFDSTSVSSEWTWLGVHTTLMTGTGPVVAEANRSIPGLGDFPTCPANCAILVRKGTQAGGRKNRGRFFFPPSVVPEVSVSGAGFMVAGHVSTLQTFFEGWRNSMLVAEMQPVLLHTDPADSPSVVTAFTVQPQLATQRLRMR